jgi:serine carboxypeptidase-like clade 1
MLHLRLFFGLALAECGARVAQAAIPAHAVTSLPGFKGPLPSKHYSGYLPVGKTSGVPGMIHYWFIESEGDPASDPVAYWTNGGPGASGISDGLLTEMGQVHVDDRSRTNTSAELEVLYNPLSWSKKANMLFVSQPKGVGFSYCVDQLGNPVNDPEKLCINTDVSAAQDAYDFFTAFFDAYPEFKKNNFFLTAESYGGTYIPMFMDQIDTKGGFPNFKGAAIGDGCWGNRVGTCAFNSGKAKQIKAEFFQGHGMYDQPLYTKIKAACGTFSDLEVLGKPCSTLLAEMNEKVGEFDVYNIYDTCGNDRSGSDGEKARSGLKFLEVEKTMASDTITIPKAHANELAAKRHPQLESTLGGALNDYPCGGEIQFPFSTNMVRRYGSLVILITVRNLPTF